MVARAIGRGSSPVILQWLGRGPGGPGEGCGQTDELGFW